MKKYDNDSVYKVTPQDVYEHLDVDRNGLSTDEVKKRQHEYGKNVLREVKGEPMWKKFLHHFSSLMAILLWFSGGIAIFADMPQLGISIWLVNVINGVFGFWQEFQAGKATDALKKMLPSFARVIRDGEEQQILTEELVVGDILIIAEGDRISVDARLVECSDLNVDQSTLTGESNPVRRNADAVLGDDLSRFEIRNLIFAGTSVSSGTGKAIVYATGMNTEFGKIADLTQNMKEEKSPLQQELDVLTKQISIIATSIGILFFIISVFFVQETLAKSFIFALGMIVAFIPEGLLPTVTLSLAIAVKRMAKENALVKKLSAVETLGSTSVICSDKTGTLTQNEMTVSNVWTLDHEYDVSGLGYAPEGQITLDGEAIKVYDHANLQTILRAAALCSNAKVVAPNEDNDRYTVLGDPTEACLGVVAQKGGINLDSLTTEALRLRELPFDSTRKRMTTIHDYSYKIHGDQRIAFVKGAPREILEISNHVERNGERVAMESGFFDEAMEANDMYARNGLRVLAVAYRALDHETSLPNTMSQYTPEIIEDDLTFLGLVVMSDPARPEVSDAVKICHDASIRIIMITGDYGLTAESIAKKIGIVKTEHPRVITGSELYKLSDDELKRALEDEVIFARVAPEQKYRVVATLQELGHIVAVTGDGVNDAPALKKADIGVAMGITGTDVAKEAADVILTDDNFASIVKAVEEGRAVYSNIRKFLTYILNSNMAEAIPSVAFLLSRGAIPLPLTIMQILAIDLGTDMLPALGLGTEQPEEGIMNKPPRKRGEALLNKKTFIIAFFWYGLILSAFAMFGYFFIYFMHSNWPQTSLLANGNVYRQATTMALAMIVFGQIGMVLNCRTENQSIFKRGIFTNSKVLIGIAVEIILIASLMYIPALQNIFDTAPLGWMEWMILILVPIPAILLDELRKKYIRNNIVKG
ncbi:cation-translocating P-type ATPase [Erysipelothrix anatis]|uniref:cation-translocating P-type ATPase n=1 Tax=Erysipelothrix anatis TaxID=2683713 RepID=UPI001407CCFE|nr:cation-transporting P-type ATPase [Erysipelothrix anatis]